MEKKVKKPVTKDVSVSARIGLGEVEEICTDVKEHAVRRAVDYRYDILDPEFLHLMAQIADYGADRYGDFNWHKSRLTGDKGPINHIYEHLRKYQLELEYDHFDGDVGWYLAAIAFNAMMEYYYWVNDTPVVSVEE